jgi:hypothetical protein
MANYREMPFFAVPGRSGYNLVTSLAMAWTKSGERDG